MSSLGFRLLAITPPPGPEGGDELDPRVVAAWREAGADEVGLAVLLRSPGAGPTETLGERRFDGLRRACGAHDLPVLLGCASEQVGTVARAGLAGVQLRGDPEEVPALDRQGFVVGRSVHAPPRGGDFDYSVFGPVFEPRTAQAGASKKPKGLDALDRCIRALPEPVFALGGLTPDNAGRCLDVGAWGLAGISAFFGPIPRVVETVGAFVALLRDASKT